LEQWLSVNFHKKKKFQKNRTNKAHFINDVEYNNESQLQMSVLMIGQKVQVKVDDT